MAVVCPAGVGLAEASGSPACRCRVEQNTLTRKHDPSSFHGYCSAAYTLCPSWRRDKERVWEADRAPLLDKVQREMEAQGAGEHVDPYAHADRR